MDLLKRLSQTTTRKPKLNHKKNPCGFKTRSHVNFKPSTYELEPQLRSPSSPPPNYYSDSPIVVQFHYGPRNSFFEQKPVLEMIVRHTTKQRNFWFLILVEIHCKT
ncbi:hypothetical protein L5515_019719 [Caenorhabditis briggsae]|uniref:Uncharacterized protein n=1 Tax=Caenorhabditis briggsae TaxID=6238 RepID=A0AAE9CXK2_CAEBR|nr:hypothetical protein L3Y34_013861 [Caenorhabditis briggsae]UMM44587.1 hypothetical protein L5515_019719 [Caenorhabditis briggsae]